MLESISFLSFVATRGPPYRACDLFDQVTMKSIFINFILRWSRVGFIVINCANHNGLRLCSCIDQTLFQLLQLIHGKCIDSLQYVNWAVLFVSYFCSGTLIIHFSFLFRDTHFCSGTLIHFSFLFRDTHFCSGTLIHFSFLFRDTCKWLISCNFYFSFASLLAFWRKRMN